MGFLRVDREIKRAVWKKHLVELLRESESGPRVKSQTMKYSGTEESYGC